MKKNILAILLLISVISFGQKKKVSIKQPAFKITYDKFDKKYTYDANAGNVGIYATATDSDFTGMIYKALTLTVHDSYLTHASGIILLFSDGTTMKIETKEELGESEGKGMWQYYVSAHLSEEQWLELSDKNIVSYKYHIFERNYKYGNQFKALVNNFYEEN